MSIPNTISQYATQGKSALSQKKNNANYSGGGIGQAIGKEIFSGMKSGVNVVEGGWLRDENIERPHTAAAMDQIGKLKGLTGKAGKFLQDHQAGISAVAGGAMAVGGAYQKNKSLNKSIDEVNKAIKTLEGSKTEIGDRLRTDRELVLDEVSEEGQRNAVSEFSDLSNQTTAAVNANRSLSSGHLNKKVQEIQKASQTKLSNIYEAKKKDGQRKVDLLVSNAKVNTDKLTAHVGTMKDTRDEMKEAQSNIARNTALDVGSIALGATGIGLPAMFAMQMGMNALKEENQYS
jgi:hypothetical protein